MVTLNQNILHQMIEAYAHDLPLFWENEKYKWEAVKQFQEEWDVNAPDFKEMFMKATSKHENLIQSGKYFPKRMMEVFADADSERVRKMFINLYDEQQNLSDRIEAFKKESDSILKQYTQAKNHFQDTRAISVYLFFRYPQKYYIYKDVEYKHAVELFHAQSVTGRTTRYGYYRQTLDFFDTIRAELLNNIGIRNFFSRHMSSDMYNDVQMNIATVDFIFYLYHKHDKLQTEKHNTTMDYSAIIKLLETNKNLILTGAPGTGKTHMAKEIAAQIMFGKDYHSLSEDERGNIGFVQFHPSYDYTDFVEGLRPIQDEKGNVGFVLRKGIFKEYCAKALEKYDSGNFDKAYDSMISEMGEETIKLKTPQGYDFGISINRRGNLRLHTGKDLKENGVLTRESLKAEFSGIPVYRWWKGYYAGVIDYIISKYHISQIQNDSNKKYVFIIDEINRGEISKIFGELFYSIDPGYRGKDGQVKTQYANMATEPNEFDIALGTTDYGHFFIPENVYIIGTMNDIDRSVESMDFAMRRRFAWKEVTAADSYTAIIENNNEFAGNKADVKQRMERLNAEIEKRFGRTYQIGAAYFLNLQNNDFEALWKNHLEGLLFEYFRGEREAQQKVDALHAIYNNEPSDTNIG